MGQLFWTRARPNFKFCCQARPGPDPRIIQAGPARPDSTRLQLESEGVNYFRGPSPARPEVFWFESAPTLWRGIKSEPEPRSGPVQGSGVSRHFVLSFGFPARVTRKTNKEKNPDGKEVSDKQYPCKTSGKKRKKRFYLLVEQWSVKK